MCSPLDCTSSKSLVDFELALDSAINGEAAQISITSNTANLRMFGG